MDKNEAERKAREYLNYVSKDVGCCITKSDLVSEKLNNEKWEIIYKEAGSKFKVIIKDQSGKVINWAKIN